MMSSVRKRQEGLISGPFLFVANPNSGTGKVREFLAISKQLEADGHSVVESKSKEHSVTLARSAYDQGFKAVVAVGGDGSVHEIGTQLIGSEMALGIIPTGSGNGVSRHIGISNSIQEAVQQIMHGKVKMMDTFTANEHACIGFCGVGIDATIAEAFDASTERGLGNYVKLSIDAFANYEPVEQAIMQDSRLRTEQVCTVVCANTSQFGNNAYINPVGKDDDGKLELVIVKHFPPVQLMPLASRLFLKSIHKSKFVEIMKGDRFVVRPQIETPFQIDGEPMGRTTEVEFRVQKRSLKVLIP